MGAVLAFAGQLKRGFSGKPRSTTRSMVVIVCAIDRRFVTPSLVIRGLLALDSPADQSITIIQLEPLLLAGR